VPEIALPAPPVGNEPMIQNREDPTAQIAIGAALVPAGECSFEGILYEVVGGFAIAAQQSVSIAA